RDAVQCIYTSGTTSRPKGVLVSHVALQIALLSNSLATRQSYGEQAPVMLVVLPLFHTTALYTLAMPVLGIGGTLVLSGPPFDPDAALDAIVKHGVTYLTMLPMMHQACVAIQAQRPRDLSGVRMAIYAMAPMPPALLDQVAAIYPNAAVILGSGQTEVVPATVMQWPQHQLTAAASWGVSTPSVRTAIMAPSGELVPTGETGEIVYRAPNVTTGYWNNPEANASAYAHGWFHSGDIGTIDTDGVVWFTDRLKDIIKTGGENVSSVQVESICMGAPGVAECSIIGLPDEKWGESVCAVVVPDGSVPDDELADSLIAYAKAHLAGFQVPKEVRIVPALPTTATSKIQQHELRRQAREG
ncbi:MAG: AMP-binding protein, partial [Dermatophilaceae bacterium]